jgi:hypothetical protein
MTKSLRAFSYVLVGAVVLGCCGDEADQPASFSLDLLPEIVQPAMAGQFCVLLAQIAEEGSGTGQGEAVALSATAPGATVVIEPESLLPGAVAEVRVIPGQISVGTDITVTLTGQRAGLQSVAQKTLTIIEGDIDEYETSLRPMADQMRNRFVPWLAANHPELNITADTAWTGAVVSPQILVVSHYLFFSEEREMHVYWHVMISPYDWARIDLRRRYSEASPSHTYEISSVSNPDELPHEADLPESLWR